MRGHLRRAATKRGAPGAAALEGLPLGRASSMLALLPMPPAWDRRAASNPPRPRGQRAESPWGPEPRPCSPGATRAAPWPFADRPLGCRGTAPPAVLSLLDDAQRHRRRRDALHLGLRPARDLWRDACALGCVARSAEEDDAGGISDETRHRHAPRPRRPSGLPLGRASPLAALLPVLPARNRRAFADPSRPREQRAESP